MGTFSLVKNTLTIAYLALYKHSLYQDDEEEAQHSSKEKVRNAYIAPQVYLITSHTSTAFLLIAFLLLVIPAGSLSFDALREPTSVMGSTMATAVFLLALAGLGLRAGLVPGHFWTPLVHPSSPANIHALLSGIAIKVSVYLMYRFFFQFLEPQPWWGYLVLVIAVITALVNVWYAIASHDLKEALGYHSNENIGIILVGMGVAMIYASDRSATAQWIVVLALVASLYHLLNHAVFKSLLYLATGAIDTLTRLVVDFHKLGGLIKRYPLTSAAFLIGAVSIAGFPPFNGFISEWLTLQALFQGAGALTSKQPLGILIIVVSLIILVASFALTAFCFYKIVGLSLLGQPRSSQQEMKQWAERDVSWKMGGVMIAIALLCLFLGLFPGRVVPLLTSVTDTLGFEKAPLVSPSWVGLQFEAPVDKPDSLPISNMFSVALVLILLSIATNILLALKHRTKYLKSEESSRRYRSWVDRFRDTLITGSKHTANPWNCGTPYTPKTMQYTGAALSELIRRMLVFLPAKLAGRWKEANSKTPDYLPILFHLSSSDAYPQEVMEHFRAIDNMMFKWLLNRSKYIGESIQNRDIRRYLVYIFLANILVLVLFLVLGD